MPGHGDCRAPTRYMYVTGAKEKKTVETAEEIFIKQPRFNTFSHSNLAGLS
jgi:hypothetical protein